MQGPLNRDEGILKIKDVISANGWNWDKISLELPSRIKMEIQATPYAVAARSEDRLAWSNNSHGKFDWKSAYNLATQVMNAMSLRGIGFGNLKSSLEFNSSFGNAFITVLESKLVWLQGVLIWILCVLNAERNQKQ